jgi:hypothetical protein
MPLPDVPAPFDRRFGTLATAPCPPFADLLIAVEREFRAVDFRATSDRLDDLARPLFALTAQPGDERAGALAMAARIATPHDASEPTAWMLSQALVTGRVAPAVRAVLAVELGRRAGIVAGVFRHRERWMVLVGDGDTRFAADVGPEVAVDDGLGCGRRCSGAHCSHGLAFEVLGGLAAAWSAAGDERHARRAAALRLQLPFDAASPRGREA